MVMEIKKMDFMYEVIKKVLICLLFEFLIFFLDFDFFFIENLKDYIVVVGDVVNLFCVFLISFLVDVIIYWYYNYLQIILGFDVFIDSFGIIKFVSIKKFDEGIYFCDGKNYIFGVLRILLLVFVIVYGWYISSVIEFRVFVI